MERVESIWIEEERPWVRASSPGGADAVVAEASSKFILQLLLHQMANISAIQQLSFSAP